LGAGHVKFFYDKCGYLKRRYEEIYAECARRDLKVTYFGNAWDNVPKEFMGDYEPTKNDRELVRQRISEKSIQSKER
jgi:hypothetical protein